MRFLLLLFCPFMLFGQSGTDIYLLEYKLLADGKLGIEKVDYASGFNPGQYNNQPSFYDENTLLISASVPTVQEGTDIYKLDIRDKSVQRLTSNPEAEYSPTFSENGAFLRCVVVDSTGDQLVWSYAMDSTKIGQTLLDKEALIGYYAVLDSQWIAYFQLGDPMKLMADNRANPEESIMINANIGRCLKVNAHGELIYVHKYADDYWVLKSWHPIDRRPQIIKKMIPNSEDFEILPDGSIMATQGSKIYHLKDGIWQMAFDLQAYGLTKLSRIAHNGKQTLAIINQPE